MKIVFIGAGSLGFGRKLVEDILSFPELQGATLHLVDTDAHRLSLVEAASRRLIEHFRLPTKLAASAGREEALAGADYVIVAIRTALDRYPEVEDVAIPQRYGLNQTVADTVGIGGIMKGLRTVPALLDIARDMERLCPNALMLNYTNPMCMIMWAVDAGTSIRSVGLCHSVQHTSHQLADYTGTPRDGLKHRVAGINHLAWFLELSRDGVDLLRLLKECLNRPETLAKDSVRFEIYRHFGYFVTESTTHMAEYVPYFLGHPEEIERLGINVGTEERRKGWRESAMKRVAEATEKPEEPGETLRRSLEYGSRIIHAIETGEPFTFNGNLRNTGLIDNLPDGCCVEVPTVADRGGLHPKPMGALPPQCAALSRHNVEMQELFVRGILEEDREAIYQSAIVDPCTAAQLTLPKIRSMMDELLAAQADLAPAFARG